MRRKVAGAVLVAAGLIINKWTIQSVLVADGEINSIGFIVVIALGQLTLLGAGWWVWSGRRVPVPSAGSAWLLIPAVGISVFMVEVLVRFTPVASSLPAPPVYVGEMENRSSDAFVADEAIGWRMHPGTEFRWTIDGHEHPYQANAEGFRDVEWSSAEGRTLVAVIGDSFSFGTGVNRDEAFPAQLNARFDGAVVRNVALPGFGIDQMLMTWRTVVRPMAPDLVIVAFVDHDLDRTMTAYRRAEGFNKPMFTVADGELRLRGPGDRPAWPMRMLERHSVVWRAMGVIRGRRAYNSGAGRWWQINRAIFETLHDEIMGDGAEVVFVRLPLRSPRAFPAADELFARLGATYVDLNSTPGPGGIHFATDDHINVAGHTMVADTLARLWPRLIGPDGQ